MFWFLLSFVLIYIMVLSYHYQKLYQCRDKEKQIMALLENYVRQTLKWSYMSIVEKDPLKAVSYSNYSVATLIGLKEYMKIFEISPKIIKSLIGEELINLENKIIHIQKLSKRRK